jgi:hypothetical protein
VPRWLDRLWLVTIAISALLMSATWIYTWGERVGYLTVAGALALLAALVYTFTRRRTHHGHHPDPLQ